MSLEPDHVAAGPAAARAFFDLVTTITSAAFPEDLFGDLGGARATSGDRLGELAATFRRIARTIHPDRQPPARVRDAHAAFVRATALRDDAERAIRAGVYGQRRAPPPPSGSTLITTPTRIYRVGPVMHRGDLADLHAASWDTPAGEESGLFKIVARPGDGDLLENEANVLRRLFPLRAREEKFRRYVPRIVDAFVAKDGDSQRRVVVLPHFAEHVSLAAVIAAHPSGLDFRDVVWMFKRLLVVLGWVHRRGLVHGAVVPPHLLVHPVDHGARLVDWCYAVPAGGRVRAVSRAYRDLYAPEILAKQPVSAATDLFMAARTALAVMGSTRISPALRGFFESCLMSAPSRRPDDAWKLHDELDELLQRLVGPPAYRRLAMPV